MKSPQTFYAYKQESSQEIYKELARLSKKMGKRVDKETPDLKKSHDLFIQSITGGKLLRGTLVKLGYDLINDSPSKAIIKPAIAYELLHTSFLIHDDIIDQSALRRGKPTMHMALGGDHYAVSQSICLGDLGFFQATKLLSESEFQSDVKNKALTLFGQISTDTILGEMLDVELAKSLVKKEADVLTIHRLKTALYTIVGPLSIGAILAGASDQTLRHIKKFGELVGIAFQIQDDILGCFGNEIQLGKSISTDIEEGKNTLLITYALQKAQASQKQILKEYYGQGPITPKAFKQILEVFQQTGSLEYSQRKAKEYITKGKKYIPNLTKDKAKQKLLNDFTDLLINRDN